MVLSGLDNERLTRVGAGTPMGDTLRRYWLPALLCEELPEPDCPPVRVRLLGEDLVAFRDATGKVGLLEEFCPHRRTSLWLGRNEEGGLRCVYHGWKFDVAGNCLHMMNEPEDSDYHTKVKAIAYPVVEMGGVVWAYMGPSDREPPAPRFEWTQVPDSHRLITKNRQECNWLQALEGGIDTAHAPILHRRITTNTTRPGIGFDTPFVQGKAPRVEVQRTDYGYCYAGVRELEGKDQNFIRAYHYVLPFHQMRPQQFGLAGGTTRTMIAGHCWVPTDDENSMVFNWLYSYGEEPLTEADRDIERQLGRGPEDLDSDYRAIRNRDNNWMIDRRVQKYETFSGIEGINTQDQAVQESMGSIVDRSTENLSASDIAIVVARRMLLGAAEIVADGGDPPGLSESYYRLRAIDCMLPSDAVWQEALAEQLYPTL